jgi:hypothetical protein
MFFVITNLYNKKKQRTYLNWIVHSHRETEKVFWQLEMFDVCTTAHIRTIFKFLSHTRQHGYIDIFTAAMIRAFRSATSRGNVGTYTVRPTIATCVARTWISYRCVPCHPWCTHRTSLVVKNLFSVFLWLWTIPLIWVLWFSCYKCSQSRRTLWNARVCVYVYIYIYIYICQNFLLMF